MAQAQSSTSGQSLEDRIRYYEELMPRIRDEEPNAEAKRILVAKLVSIIDIRGLFSRSVFSGFVN